MVVNKNMQSLSIIVVTYNDSKFILPCLRELRDSINQTGVVLTVIDNNSSDRTKQLIKNNFPTIPLVELKENIKLSRALNLGAKMFPAKKYLFLNPDVLIKYSEVQELAQFMDTDEKLGIIGPKLVYPDGSIQYSCRQFPNLWNVLLRGFGFTEDKKFMPKSLHRYLMTEYDHITPTAVDWILLACLMVKNETMTGLEGFDKKLPLYYNDMDFCWRAWKKGWGVMYYPKIKIVHYYQRSSEKNLIFNRSKWSHFFSAVRFLIKKNFL